MLFACFKLNIVNDGLDCIIAMHIDTLLISQVLYVVHLNGRHGHWFLQESLHLSFEQILLALLSEVSAEDQTGHGLTLLMRGSVHADIVVVGVEQIESVHLVLISVANDQVHHNLESSILSIT